MHGFLVQQSALRAPVDTYRGALYPNIFIFYFIFVFISISEDTWSQKLHESAFDKKSASSRIYARFNPTKCIAWSLDTYRGALCPIFITFSCVFVFISPPRDLLSCAIVICTVVIVLLWATDFSGRVRSLARSFFNTVLSKTKWSLSNAVNTYHFKCRHIFCIIRV